MQNNREIKEQYRIKVKRKLAYSSDEDVQDTIVEDKQKVYQYGFNTEVPSYESKLTPEFTNSSDDLVDSSPTELASSFEDVQEVYVTPEKVKNNIFSFSPAVQTPARRWDSDNEASFNLSPSKSEIHPKTSNILQKSCKKSGLNINADLFHSKLSYKNNRRFTSRINTKLRNVNPFTPENRSIKKGKNNDLDDSLSFRTTINRYNEEFIELSKVGGGNFGEVYKCQHKLDGCHYAIKKLKTQYKKHKLTFSAIKEVFISAVIHHKHMVRYFNSWFEGGTLYIQNEFCNAGSLADRLLILKKNDRTLTEDQVKHLMSHVLKGLKYIHSNDFAHLDIKPGNILREIGFGDQKKSEDFPLYKIGDFGHVTNVDDSGKEEGDIRYMAPELLNSTPEDDVTKSDIFSTGMTIYECLTNVSMPIKGDLWHLFRNEDLPKVKNVSEIMNKILNSMCLMKCNSRPTAKELLESELLVKPEHVDNKTLIKQLNEMKKELALLKNKPPE